MSDIAHGKGQMQLIDMNITVLHKYARAMGNVKGTGEFKFDKITLNVNHC